MAKNEKTASMTKTLTHKKRHICKRLIAIMLMSLGVCAVTYQAATAHTNHTDNGSCTGNSQHSLSNSIPNESRTDSEHPGDSLQSLISQSFATLSRNRQTYNRYNDSIFTIRGHEAWTQFFLRRAIANHAIYEENKQAIATLDELLRQYADEPSGSFHQMFYDEIMKYASAFQSDPFLTMHFCKPLNNYYNSDKRHGYWDNNVILNMHMAYCAKQMSYIGNDTSYLRQSYEYTKQAMREDAKTNHGYNWARTHALRNIVRLAYYNRGQLQPLDEIMDCARQLKDLVAHADSLDKSYFNNERDFRDACAAANNFEESLIRNVYMVDSTAMDKSVADSLMHALVRRNLATPRLGANTMLRTMLMQIKLGDISIEEARKKAYSVYRNDWKGTYSNRKLSPTQLREFVEPFSTFFYLNDMADIPYRKKRSTVRRICRNIEAAYKNRIDQQSDAQYVMYLNHLSTYKRITRYLTPDERVLFLNSLNVATQVTTYAHSAHVAYIASMLAESIVEHEPQLLIGMLGCKNAADVRRKKKMLTHFCHEAALYHDLGKNSIIPVVHNDYRPIFDEEYAIIKRHPELGLRYLNLSPKLAKYHDTTLGHHKWYNGKGGYPDSFDNTRSPYRTLIDLITLADCMQAATERVGRNYKGNKTFDSVMEEFQRDAGTRYNPDLVRFISSQDELCSQLRDNLDTGWLDIYYGIYSQFINN